MDLRIPISDKVFLALAGVCGAAFGINYMYLVQRSWDGLYVLPLWLILLDIALVAGPMRDNKMTAYIGLLCAACFVEYQHMQVVKKDVDQFYFVLLALLIYGSSLLFFQLMLFGRLNRIEADHQIIAADVKSLADEAKRLNLSIEKTIRGEGDPGGAAAASNYGLYRRALSELFPVKARKDVPGYLTRTLREGFGMDRGVVLEVPESGEAAVREMWGEGLSRTGAAMAAFKVPAGLVEMVREKSGAVLESELVGEGPHQDDVAQLASTGFEPVAMFPLMVRDAAGQPGDERPSWVVMAVRPVAKSEGGEAEEPAVNTSGSGVVKGLRILPIQSVLDIAGQFVSRANLK